MGASQQQQRVPGSGPTTPAESTGGGAAFAADAGNAARATDLGLSHETGANPTPRSDASGSATTTDANAEAFDAFNAPTAVDPGVDAALDEYAVERHPSQNPLLVQGPPAETDLFSFPAPVCDGETAEGEHFTSKQGTVTAPFLFQQPVDDPLYIDGAVSVEDVHQVGIGDCFFEATLASITARDPSHIESMISDGGSSVTITFYRHDGASWVPAPVTVDKGLARERNPADGAVGGLVGAGFRMDPTPERTEWSGDIDAEVMSVTRVTYHELALWAPMFEKAYASFAEQYGKYGGNPAVAGDGPGGPGESGYDMIDGGDNQFTYALFYGPDLVTDASTQVSFAPEANLVIQNRDILAQLLLLSGQGVGSAQTAFVEAATFTWEVFPRIKSQIDAVLADLASERSTRDEEEMAAGLVSPLMAAGVWVGDRVSDALDGRGALPDELSALKAKIDTWTNASDADKPTALEDVAKACTTLASPGAFPVLHDPDAPASARHLLELVAIGMNSGTDTSEGQRNVYSEHSYSVLGARFVGSDGSELALTTSNLDTELPNVSAAASEVHLRNPHGRNEPNVDGAEEDPATNDGLFDMSLDSFLRAFTLVRSGVATTS